MREYEILKAALAEDEPLLFIDAVHPNAGNKSDFWLDQKKGIDKLIETTKGWTRLNIVGAI
jgi:hypothetical protein